MKEIENTPLPVYPSDLLKKEMTEELFDVINDFVIPLINKREKDVKHKEELIKLVRNTPKKDIIFDFVYEPKDMCYYLYLKKKVGK